MAERVNMSTPANLPDAPPAAAAPIPAPQRRRFSLMRDDNVLGLAWIHGEFHAAVFRRQDTVDTWTSPTSVTTIDDLSVALDGALQALKFGGTDVFLILEHERFQHQPEQAPAFSETATRGFLKAHVSRIEQERGPVLWVSQKTQSQRNEASVLLHLLDARFYAQLNGLMLARRLELTRIVPLVVPLHAMIDAMPDAREQPVMLTAPAGRMTIVVAGRAGQPLLFTRSILAPWNTAAERLAVEFNRSLLYAKQQFSEPIERLRLLGQADEVMLGEVRARCSTAQDVATLPVSPFDWMLTVARLPARHRVNLVAGYLSYKQRQRFLRRVLVATCTLALVLSALEVVLRVQSGSQERARLQALAEAEPVMRAEQQRLAERNLTAAEHAALIAEAEAARIPPVPSRFLAFLAGVLPAEMRLTSFSVKPHEDHVPGWFVRLEGVARGEQDATQEMLAELERRLAQSPFRAVFGPRGRATVVIPADELDALPRVRFTLEGGLLEN